MSYEQDKTPKPDSKKQMREVNTGECSPRRLGLKTFPQMETGFEPSFARQFYEWVQAKGMSFI